MEFLLGLAIGIVGIVATIVVALYQNRMPDVQVKCTPLADGDPCGLEVTVSNSGRAESRQLHIGFNWYLPVETAVFATPELGAEIVESANPPDPRLLPAGAKVMKAFSVRVPLVAPRSSLTLLVRTTDQDNLRAARQLMRIRAHIEAVIHAFNAKLPSLDDPDAHLLVIQDLLAARTRQDVFFKPGNYSYEKGVFPVQYISPDEEVALAVFDDLIGRHKKGLPEVFEKQPSFKAPVVKIKTSKGQGTYAIFPPFIETRIEMRVPLAMLRERKPISLEPPIPESYD